MSVKVPLTAEGNFSRLMARYGELLSADDQAALAATLATPLPRTFG